MGFLSGRTRQARAGPLWQAVWLLLTLSLWATLSGRVWAEGFDEYAIKAAYLYNFAKFVEWPPQSFSTASAPLVICIAGFNPFGDALSALADKTVENHPVELRHSPDARGFNQCHILFISRGEQGRFRSLLAQCSGLPILTVSDIGAFAQMGGMVGLVESEQRIRFEINLHAARQAGLSLSSQLLKLALNVIQEGRSQ